MQEKRNRDTQFAQHHGNFHAACRWLAADDHRRLRKRWSDSLFSHFPIEYRSSRTFDATCACRSRWVENRKILIN